MTKENKVKTPEKEAKQKKTKIMKKVKFPVNKHYWQPSLIPGPVTLVSTINKKGEPNIAPISWIQMACFKPPMIMMSVSKGSKTAENILRTKCFGVNFVDSSLAKKVYACIKWRGRERIEKTGLTFFKAKKIRSPLINECRAHLECALYKVNDLSVFFGKIENAMIWDKIAEENPENRYGLLDQVLFLESGIWSRPGKAVKIADWRKL